MRLSLGSVAALAAGLLVALALWPEGNALQGPARVVGETTEAAPPPAALVKVEVAQPIARDVPDSRDCSPALTGPSRKVEIRAQASGYLNKAYFPAGGTVKQGQQLFQIDNRRALVDVARAKAEAERVRGRAEIAKKAYQLSKEANEKVAESVNELTLQHRLLEWKEAEAMEQAADADLKIAHINLDYSLPYAPMAGQISRPDVDEGNLVNADKTVLATLSVVDPLTVQFKLDEGTFLQLRQAVRAGEVKVEEIPIAVALSGESDFAHQARLESLDGELSSSEVLLRASLPNPDLALVPGQQATVRVTTSKPRPGLLVPLAAMNQYKLRVGSGGFVYVVEKDGAARVRNLMIAGVDGDFAVIREGLQPDEWVVNSWTSDAQGLREGQLVEPVRTKFEP